MALRAGDEVIALRVPRPDEDLIVVTEQGYGKRTPVDEYPIKGRGTLGVLTVDRQAIARRGQLVGAVTAGAGDDLMVITAGGIVTRQAVGEIRQTGRATQGVIVQKLRDEDDRIAAVATIRDPGEGNGDEVPVDGAPIPQVEPPAEPADDDAGV
jgi:DNA gyrase subunit A